MGLLSGILGGGSSTKVSTTQQTRVGVEIAVQPEIVIVNEIDNSPIQNLVNRLSETEVVQAAALKEGLTELAQAQAESARTVLLIAAGVGGVVLLRGARL